MKRLALLSLALAACGGKADRPAWRGTIDTLPSGVIVVNNPAAGIWDSTTAWKLTEELVIGSEEDSATTLYEPTALEVDSAGRIYILDRQRPALLIFDSTGRLLKTIGRDGNGPGEFRLPSGLGWDASGHLWVVEGPSMRYSVFDRDGRFIKTNPRLTGGYGYFWNGKFLNTGDLIEQVDRRNAAGHTDPVLVRYDSIRGMVDTLTLPYTLSGENFYKLEQSNGYTVVSIPYYPSNWMWIDPRGYVWTGNTGRYELTQLDWKGDTVRVIRKEQPPLTVTAAERDSAITGIRKMVPGAVFDEGRIPKVKPMIERFMVDDRGYVFLLTTQPAGTAGTVFEVLDPEGQFLGQITTPRRIVRWPGAPMIIRSGKLWAEVVGEDDVPRVVRWRILRGR